MAQGAVLGLLSLAFRKPFLARYDGCCRLLNRHRAFLRNQPEHRVLFRPFGRSVTQASDADAARWSAVDRVSTRSNWRIEGAVALGQQELPALYHRAACASLPAAPRRARDRIRVRESSARTSRRSVPLSEVTTYRWKECCSGQARRGSLQVVLPAQANSTMTRLGDQGFMRASRESAEFCSNNASSVKAFGQKSWKCSAAVPFSSSYRQRF